MKNNYIIPVLNKDDILYNTLHVHIIFDVDFSVFIAVLSVTFQFLFKFLKAH